jgi:hypothetical protein
LFRCPNGFGYRAGWQAVRYVPKVRGPFNAVAVGGNPLAGSF